VYPPVLRIGEQLFRVLRTRPNDSVTPLRHPFTPL
jgi:hypothetical protein